MNLRAISFILAAFLALYLGASAPRAEEPQPEAPPDLKLAPWVTGLDRPLYLTHAGDRSGRVFVVEQAGKILIIEGGELLPQPFLDIRDRVVSGGEMGLLGLAFHPRFAENGRFFINYTRHDGETLKTVIAEHRVPLESPYAASRKEKIILEVVQPYSNHNGGQVAFGPDGFLYIGLGDGGSAGDPHGNGQSLETLLGKILRIDVDKADPYAAPEDNPFVGKPGADEIWAYGLRNPWRFSFDWASGKLFAADVGQNKYEEIDLIEPGGNYGWNTMEGMHCFPPSQEDCAKEGLILPIAEYEHKEGISVTGGYVYWGKAVPELQGVYLFGDFGTSAVWGLWEVQPGTWQRRLLLLGEEPISSFGEDEDQDVYVVGYGGTIYRILKKG